MFRSFRLRERDALAPLLDIVRQQFGADRTRWLNELRLDAPTVAARIEALLTEEAVAHDLLSERPSATRDRASMQRGLSLSDPTLRSSVA